MRELETAEQVSRILRDLGELSRKVANLRTEVDAVQGTQAAQAEVLGAFQAVAEGFDELVQRFNALFPPLDSDGEKFYSPKPTPRLWKLKGTDRDKAIARIRVWVDMVYRPTFGHISASLKSCWDQHPLCLTILDVLMELHGVHFLQPVRNQGLLNGQAELLSRVMPALADIMRTEQTKNCRIHETPGLHVADQRQAS